MSIRFGFVVAALLLVAACDQKPKQETKAPVSPPAVTAPVPSPVAAAPAHLIREGVGVAGVALGMSPADVERVLGKPEHTNKAGQEVVFMGYDADGIFGIYFGENRVRMIIAARKDKTWCTDFDVCLYREGDLKKLKAHHGAKLLRFVDRDGSVTYRLLAGSVMTEYTPVEDRDGVVQVTVMNWDGPVDRSGFD
ncbi:MAG: hypothetical protein HOP13_04975 [Alphaproteobacteria bacterium]|nr:hypothetical protein [Alphaproteobacteria bacterium]